MDHVQLSDVSNPSLAIYVLLDSASLIAVVKPSRSPTTRESTIAVYICPLTFSLVSTVLPLVLWVRRPFSNFTGGKEKSGDDALVLRHVTSQGSTPATYIYMYIYTYTYTYVHIDYTTSLVPRLLSLAVYIYMSV